MRKIQIYCNNELAQISPIKCKNNIKKEVIVIVIVIVPHLDDGTFCEQFNDFCVAFIFF